MPNDTITKNAAARARVAAKQANPLFTPFENLKLYYGEQRSRTQIRRDIEAGNYPAPKQVSKGRIGWLTAELDAHYNARPTVNWAPKGRAA